MDIRDPNLIRELERRRSRSNIEFPPAKRRYLPDVIVWLFLLFCIIGYMDAAEAYCYGYTCNNSRDRFLEFYEQDNRRDEYSEAWKDYYRRRDHQIRMNEILAPRRYYIPQYNQYNLGACYRGDWRNCR